MLDGTTGLNMLNQAKEFNETVALTGLILTKLDGTARGGAVVSLPARGAVSSWDCHQLLSMHALLQTQLRSRLTPATLSVRCLLLLLLPL